MGKRRLSYRSTAGEPLLCYGGMPKHGRGGETAIAAGAEFFRTRVSSSTRKSFEDVVIFVTDMEKAIEKLV